MANYVAHARTNYFKVKDLEAFKAGLHPIIGIWEDNAEGLCLYTNDDCGAWPTDIPIDDEWEDYQEYDLFQYVASHLQDQEVAIFMEIGYEKLRYLTGSAIAVNAKGETKAIHLSDIYEQALELKPKPYSKKNPITYCEY